MVSSEHLIVALLELQDPTAGRALSAAGVTAVRCRQVLYRGPALVSPDLLPLSESLRIAFKGARYEAVRFASNQIATEHFLLAVITTDEDALAELLKLVGTSPQQVRVRLEETIMGIPVPRRAWDDGARLIQQTFDGEVIYDPLRY